VNNDHSHCVIGNARRLSRMALPNSKNCVVASIFFVKEIFAANAAGCCYNFDIYQVGNCPLRYSIET